MSNVRLTNSLLNALIECDGFEGAARIFHKMEKTEIGYGNLMSRFNDAERPEKTLAFYEEMKRAALQEMK